MNCPYCGCEKTQVKDSRPSGTGVRRRRLCEDCGRRFSTKEDLVQRLKVHKNDGSVQEFSPEKLGASLELALRGERVRQPLPELVERVQQSLLERGLERIRSRDIAEAAMGVLESLNRVGFVRYAAPYRPFEASEGPEPAAGPGQAPLFEEEQSEGGA